MPVRLLAFVLGLGLLLTAAKKEVPGTARGENEDLVLNVTLYDNPADVKQLLGDDLGGHYIVADVHVDPKYGKEILIDHNDFVLHTFKDGEKTTPFEASQVAGVATVTLTQGKSPGAASPGMVLGGPLVLHGGGLGSKSDSGNGDAKAQPSKDAGKDASGKDAPPKDTDQKDADQKNQEKKDNPLEKMLAEKVLPEKKTDQTTSGLLYFPMEKQKRKDLELTYGGRSNRITLVFK